MKRNEDQKKEIGMLDKGSEIEEQEEIVKREISKQKQMYKMLTKHKKEEDENFKSKFQLLVVAEETRAKLKEDIQNAKIVEPKEKDEE